jgi:hypothetical protein
VLDQDAQVGDDHTKRAAGFQKRSGVAQGLLAIPQAEVLQHMGAIHGLAGGLRQRQAPDDVTEVHLLREQGAVAGEHPAKDGELFQLEPGGAIKVAPTLRHRQAAAVLHIRRTLL